MNFRVDMKLVRTVLKPGPVVREFRKGAAKVLTRFGAYVRSDVIRSLRPARRKTESELTAAERAAYMARVAAWRRQSRDTRGRFRGKAGQKPKLPYANAAPGHPPLLHGPKSPLRLIRFDVDRTRMSVIVGPKGAGRRPGVAPPALEYGGTSVTTKRGGGTKRVRVRPHPFMDPAFTKNVPHLRRWRNAL